MLHLHSILRWIILLLLLICLVQALSKSIAVKKMSLWLLISAHLMFVVGIYQLFFGRFGINKGLPAGVELMKDKFYRFFWVEHPLMMLLAIILITVARGKAKVLNYKAGRLAFCLLRCSLYLLRYRGRSGKSLEKAGIGFPA